MSTAVAFAIALQLPEDLDVDKALERADVIADKIKTKLISLIPADERLSQEEQYKKQGWKVFAEEKPNLNDIWAPKCIVRLAESLYCPRVADYYDTGTVLIDGIDVTNQVIYWMEFPE